MNADRTRNTSENAPPPAVIVGVQVQTVSDTAFSSSLTELERSTEEEEFVIPYDQQAKVALLHERCRALSERYDEDGAHIRVRAPGSLLGGLRRDL